MKRKKTRKTIKIWSVIVFLITFLATTSCSHLIVLNRRNEEKLKATYTAESTVSRIELQLNKYLAKSNLLKQIIQSGIDITDEEFNSLAQFMMDDDIIEAIEMAKDGIVSQVYPLEDNEKAMGLDMLQNPERKESARLAKNSGEYTTAGPFQLVQGGLGILMFDPIYRTDEAGREKFWGFSIIVLNWEKIVSELELNKLEDASYHYKIWRKDIATGESIIISQSQNGDMKEPLEVACHAPNDTWYLDIEPTSGWGSRVQLFFATVLCLGISFLMAISYWQYEMRSYKDAIYAKKLERSAKRERAANAAKTSFLSRMSHDIRTPLNGIIGLLKIDEMHPDDKQLIEENRVKMGVAANHLLALINDVLQMSKLENGEVVLAHEVMDLNQLSADVITIMEQRAADAGVTLEYDKRSDKIKFPYVYGSPLHVRQLFLNIYGNCIKYNTVGGKVKTYVEFCNVSGNIVTYRWTISDTGIGMSKEFVKHIFEPFAQEHSDARSVYSGTGLGMAIVQALVEHMNGTIEVSSQEGKGSTFVITIPFEIAKKPAAKSLPQQAAEIRGMHLLLAEDNELNAEIAQMLLSDAGAELTIVQDGQQAVDVFQAEPIGTFDAILMDIMMPRMDGISAAKAIRAVKREDAASIPIIAMTANAFEEDAKQCMEAGMNAHLSKPLQLETVIRTIASCCRESKNK